MTTRQWMALVLAGTGLAFAAYLLGAFSHARDLWPIESLRELKRQLVGTRPHDAPLPPAPPRYVRDESRRLVAFARPKTEIDCPGQDEETWVLLILGQSNAANYHGQRHSSAHGAQVVNFFDGRCFVAESPLLGSSGSQGESWTLLGNELVAAGAARRVVLVPAAIASSPVSRWQEGGDLNVMLSEVLGHLSPRYRVTHVLWHQGEADFIDGTAASDYRRMFLSLVASLRARGVAAPVFASMATRCGIRPDWTEANALAEAQRSLPDPALGIHAGVDTDRLLDFVDRHDDCHFSGSGGAKVAAAWLAILAGHGPAPGSP